MHPGREEKMRKRKCNTCKYRTYITDNCYCQYILVTGKMRNSSWEDVVKKNVCSRYKKGKQEKTLDQIAARTKYNTIKQHDKHKKNKVKKAVILKDANGNKYKFASIVDMSKWLNKHYTTVLKQMKRGDGKIYGYTWKFSESNKE